MMRFEWQYDKDSAKVVVEIPNPDADLEEVITHFEGFLKAATYVFDGTLDIVEKEGK